MGASVTTLGYLVVDEDGARLLNGLSFGDGTVRPFSSRAPSSSTTKYPNVVTLAPMTGKFFPNRSFKEVNESGVGVGGMGGLGVSSAQAVSNKARNSKRSFTHYLQTGLTRLGSYHRLPTS